MAKLVYLQSMGRVGMSSFFEYEFNHHNTDNINCKDEILTDGHCIEIAEYAKEENIYYLASMVDNKEEFLADLRADLKLKKEVSLYKNNNITIAGFLRGPTNAITKGYNPSFMDCISFAASVFTFKSTKKMIADFCDLFDESIKDLPIEFIKWIVVWLVYISIPFGGFVVLGLTLYFMECTPSKIKKRRARHEKWKKEALGDI